MCQVCTFKSYDASVRQHDICTLLSGVCVDPCGKFALAPSPFSLACWLTRRCRWRPYLADGPGLTAAAATPAGPNGPRGRPWRPGLVLSSVVQRRSGSVVPASFRHTERPSGLKWRPGISVESSSARHREVSIERLSRSRRADRASLDRA